MNIYEKIAFLLNIFLLVFIILRLISILSIAAPFLTIMLIISLYKISFDERIEEIKKKTLLIEKISEGIEKLMNSILQIRDDFMISTFRVEQKVEKNRKEIEDKMENNYRDVSKKIIEIENKMHEIKKSLASYILYVEEIAKRSEEKS